MIVDLQPAVLQSIEVTNIDPVAGTLTLDYTLMPDNNYIIEIQEEGQPGFVVVDTIVRSFNPASFTITGLNTRDKYYNVSITSFDPCDGDRRQSNIGSSIRLQVNPENRQNRVTWELASTDFLNYGVIKDGVQATLINTQNQKQYIDNQVVCGGQYDYKVVMRENNGFTSTSGEIEVTAISTDVPDPITDISASVIGESIELTWPAPTTFFAEFYLVYKSLNGVNFQIIDTIQTETYVDQDVMTISTPYYYKINYLDACDNLSSDSPVAQSILLTLSPDQTISWTSYTGWGAGVQEYVIEKYDDNGVIIQQISVGAATSYTEPQDNPYQFITYTVRAVPQDPALNHVNSNSLKVIYRSKVAFPNAFSPNGDGENDIFNFKSRYISAVIMKIYNRWGELVYQTNQTDKGWDGNINGKPAPLGTYIHHCQFTDDMGVSFIKSGEIVLIR
jgi:gliding motility-associated-like protein